MIAACPKCAARYRIDRAKIGEAGVRLRCSRCESVFRVRAPAEGDPARQPSPTESGLVGRPNAGEGAAAPVERAPAPSPQVQTPASAPSDDAQEPTRDARVLIAMPDAELAKRVGALLEVRGIETAVVFDGVDAMLETQRQLPEAVLLAADLPKMFGFQVCEVIKRNESLRKIHVVLAGAIHHPDRYRRSPSELYGADTYVEVPDLPDGLIPILERAGVLGDALLPPEMSPPSAKVEAPPAEAGPTSEEAAAPGLDLDPPAPETGTSFDPFQPMDEDPALGIDEPPGPGPKPSAVPDEDELQRAFEPPASSPEPPAPALAPPKASPEQAEERAQAERLARIIVSDIVLYNEEKFAAAVSAGNVASALEADLEEGRGLFDQRIDEGVRRDTDFLMEELLRVARARGMQ